MLSRGKVANPFMLSFLRVRVATASPVWAGPGFRHVGRQRRFAAFPESLGPLGESKSLMRQAPTGDRSKPDLGLRPWQRLSIGWHAS
jgi:hypothetical protein